MPEHPMLAETIRNLGSEGRREQKQELLARLERAEEVVRLVVKMGSIDMGLHTEVDTEKWEELETDAFNAYQELPDA